MSIAGFFGILLHSALVVSKIRRSRSCFNEGLCSKNKGIEKNTELKNPPNPLFQKGNANILFMHLETIMLRVLLLALGLLCFLAGCTTAHHDLTSFPESFSPRTVIVSLDTWHAMLAFPVHSRNTLEDDEQKQEFEEWGYAERAWYVEEDQGISGMIRALLWPTEGVVEMGRHSSIWAERTPQPPADVFVFQLEKEPYRQLREFLASTIDSSTPVAIMGNSKFYSSVRPYHLFHTCHQYAAYALHVAGFSLTPALAFHSKILGWQLQDLPQNLHDPS
jgi:hypothetical protein